MNIDYEIGQLIYLESLRCSTIVLDKKILTIKDPYGFDGEEIFPLPIFKVKGLVRAVKCESQEFHTILKLLLPSGKVTTHYYLLCQAFPRSDSANCVPGVER